MAYNKLSTANLPDPVIDPAQGSSPEDYFNTVLYTGNGGTSRSITGMGFQADFLWHKDRSAARNHSLVDVIRGTNDVQSNATTAERSMPSFVSFDSDGFTVTQDGSTNPNWNENSITKVVWGWKANGSGVSNTDGSITSTVSANTTSGFSVGTFVGNQTAGATVGHGLSQAPEMIIIKDRPTVNDWPVYHASISPSQTIKLNSANAAFTESTIWNNTAPTTSVFTLGSSNLANNNTKSHVFYAFHSVEGFSKFGSYVGNDSPDGNFIYTGFSPALIVIKYVSGTAGGTKNWYVWDNARSPQNVNDNILYWNSSGSEGGDSAFDIDRLSNGFKLRNSEGGVNNAATYIYMAFAENPFKYSNAR